MRSFGKTGERIDGGVRRGVGSFVVGLLHYPVLFLCLIGSFVHLIRALPVLKVSKKIVVMGDGGFGHTVVGPEAARRLLKGENPVFIILSGRNFHNSIVATLWPDIRVLFLRLVWRIRIFGHEVCLGGPSLRMRELLSSLLVQWLSRFTDAEIVSQQQLYDRLEALYSVEAIAEKMHSIRWVAGWSHLLGTVPAPKVHLPLAKRQMIRRRMDHFSQRSFPFRSVEKLCCLYLRTRQENGNLESLRRIGSPFEAYLPAIQYLIEQRYRVLVTGDREVPLQYAQELNGRILCAQFLNVEPWDFDLFAATESDLWVGDTGGGTWLSIINEIPMLVLNAFPYGFGVPNACMYYKTVRDEAGRRVAYSQLFSEYPYDYQMKGMTVVDNSAEEIREAVEAFVTGLSEPTDNERSLQWRQSLPDYVLAKYVNCWISPAWLRLFDSDPQPHQVSDPWQARLKAFG